MKYQDLLGVTVIDAEQGHALGRIVEVLTQDGSRIEAFRLWNEKDDGRVFLAVCKSVVLREEIILAERKDGDPAGLFAYQRGIPVITKEGCISGIVRDYEFDEYGRCLRVAGSHTDRNAADVRIGAQAVIEKESAEDPMPETEQAQESEKLPSREEPGCELLGRIALREIRNALGEAVLAKGARVDRELLRQAIDEGWLVALAAGTAAKHT